MRPNLKLLIAALLVTCLAGWVFKAHCVGPGYWLDAQQYSSGCYSDAVPFWGLRGVAAGQVPYFEARMEYPVLTGALIWIEGGVARALFGDGVATAFHFLLVVTAVNAALALAVLILLWRAGLDGWRLWAWAAAPPLVLYLGHNWDMLAITLTVLAMLAAHAGRSVSAGGLAGIGVAAKLFPVVLLPIVVLGVLARPGPGFRDRLLLATACGTAGIVAYALVNAPVAALAFTNWSEFYRFSSERAPTAASVWAVLAEGQWLILDIATMNLSAAVLFVAGFVAIVAAGWHRHRAHLWVLFTPALAWFMLTNKVHSPQFDLWLYPMMLMTVRRPLPIAVFAIADVAAYFAEFWWFAGMEGATPAATPAQIALAVMLRTAAMLWVIASAVRDPAPDWMRSEGVWKVPDRSATPEAAQ